MANAILSRRADRSVARALREAIQGKRGAILSYEDVKRILAAAHDYSWFSDLEFRDLKRMLRQQPLDRRSIGLIDTTLQLFYMTKGPFVYPGKIETFEGRRKLGNHQCAALVQRTIPIGLTRTWREGIPVRGNGHRIRKGTAVATFEDGFYPNRPHGNHVAYYISQDGRGVLVMDQWKARNKPSVSSRRMPFLGRKANGLFVNPSNNGEALSVIMRRS